jgi:hypothetical protein
MSMLKSRVAEEKWELSIQDYLSPLYQNKWIPSHDLSHHKRVWHYARELTNKIELRIKPDDEYFYEKLILACYFHDTGLLKDTGEVHGKLSRNFCESFLQIHQDKIRFDPTDMLEAIENHDKKQYENTAAPSLINLLDVISIADDFDAFGVIGAYRYMEIYILRAMPHDEIPQKILENASSRYNNFIHVINKLEIKVPAVKPKYDELRELLLPETYKENAVSMVTWIHENIVRPKYQPDAFIKNLNKNKISNQRLLAFLSKYSSETDNPEISPDPS